MIPGLRAPQFKIFHKGVQLTHKFTRLRYVEAEEEDDQIEVTLQTEDVNLVARPEFNEKELWTIIISYAGEPGEFKGVAFIDKVVPTCDKDGVKVSITLQDKAAQLKKVKSNASYGGVTLPGAAVRVGEEQNMNVYLENPGHAGAKGKHYIRVGEKPTKSNGEASGKSQVQSIMFMKPEVAGIYRNIVDPPKKSILRQANSPAEAEQIQNEIAKTESQKPEVIRLRKAKDVEELTRKQAEADMKDIRDRAFLSGQYIGSMGISSYLGGGSKDSRLSTDEAVYEELSDYLKSPRSGPFNPPNFKSLAVQRLAIKVDPALRAALESGRLPPNKVDLYLEKLWKFRMFGGAAQGNKSHAQMLKALAKKQSGNYRVIGHGNDLIIRKRNFNQTPVAQFTYKSSTEALIEFTPVTKNKSQESKATAVSYSGWDKKKKKHYAGTVTHENAPDQGDIKTGGGVRNQFIPGPSTHIPSYYNFNGVVKGEGNITFAEPPAHNYFPGGISQATPTYPGAIKEANTTPNNPSKHIISAASTMEETVEQAGNVHQEANEKLNPANLSVQGDLRLRAGKMVTVLGVGDKYNGNYYITKVVHELNQDTTYVSTVEIITNTQGAAFKLGKTKQFLKSSDKTINTKVRDNSPFNNTKRSVKYKHQ